MFEIKLFGDFQIIFENGILNEENIHSDKLVKLLAYVLIHKDRSLSVQELSENLWNEDETDNPAGALKNLIYRLRRLLKQSISADDFIISERGAYRWNATIPIKMDIDTFKILCHKAKKESQTELAIEHYEEAVKLYSGELLSRYSNENWMIPLATYYHSMFLTSVKELAQMYEDKEKYETVEQLCSNALKFDMLDEQIHCFLIHSLIKQNKPNLALEYYEKASKILCNTLNIKNPEKLQLIYEELLKMTKGEATDPIETIGKDMFEKTNPEGVFICGYAVFKEIFRLELRRIDRLAISEHILLITLSIKNECFPQKESMNKYVLDKSMKQMLEVLIDSLRKGDVAAKYSDTQYIVLLPFSVYETALMISDRIATRFYEKYKNTRIQIKRDIEAVGTVGVVQMMIP